MGSRSGSTDRTRGAAVIVALCVVFLPACHPRSGTGATLAVNAPEADRDADVFVDGNYIGQVSELSTAGTAGLKLAPGVHRVEIRKHGRFPVQKTIRVDAKSGASVTVTAELLEDPQ